MTPRPHDALFKSAFEAPAAAAALLRELLPVVFRELIAWDTLHGEPASFVDPDLADLHSDLLYAAQLRTDPPGRLHVLLEHQSTADPGMPLRALSYRTRIWNRSRKQHPEAWLPPILTVLVSHVPGGWTTSRSLDDLFDPGLLAIPDLAASVPRCSMIIEDLAGLSDDDLQERSLAAFQKLALWLLRDARAPRRLLDSFDTWIEAFAEAERAPAGIDAITALLTYLFRVIGPVHRGELRAKIRQLGPRAEEISMTIAEQLHEEGHEEGLAKGLAKGREEGLAKGREEGRIAALQSLLVSRFGSQALDAIWEARLRAATAGAIDRYLQRVVFAASLAAVFED
jgi:DNA-directed RNA polymerase specialized sigma24 family protein